MLLSFWLLKHVYKINKAPVENESLSWYFVSSLRSLPCGRLLRLMTKSNEIRNTSLSG
jgi:hypothetical protein